MTNVFLQNWWQFVIVALVSYFIGAINFAILFSRLIKLQDVRNYGSGNAGTTNMFRVYGPSLGVLTFVCDCLKGVVCCLGVKLIFANVDAQLLNQLCYVAGVFSVVGHVFPIYYKFRGGKGVATAIGVMFSVQPILSLCMTLPVILIILITDRVAISSLCISLFSIIWAWVVLLKQLDLVCCISLTVMFLLVIFAHRGNILRLLKGKENPSGVHKALFGKKKNTSTAEQATDLQNIDSQSADQQPKDDE